MLKYLLCHFHFVQETLNWMKALDAETVNTHADQFESLRHGYIIPGDVVYVPAGHIFVEKALQANNVSLRATSLLITHDQCASVEAIASAYSK